MRLVRLDHLPGGRSLELHPRLTVVLGAPPDVRAALADVARAVTGGDSVPYEGQVELHGIRLGLHDRSFDVLDGAWIDPVLDLDAPSPLRPVASGRRQRPPGGGRPRGAGPVVEMRSTDEMLDAPTSPGPGSPPPVDERRDAPSVFDAGPSASAAHAGVSGTDAADPARHTRRIATEDLVRLRAELRSLDGERMVLGRRADEARGDLDSFARATLDVATDQLEAVESRRAAAAAEQAGWAEEHAERRAELMRRVEALHAELAAQPVGGSDEVRSALERLVALLQPTGRPDPVAQRLADELEDVRRSMEDLDARRMVVEGFLADAEAQLEEARRESDAAFASIRSPDFDHDVVRNLEAVRDEIYELEERGGRVAAARARRRIDELRAEEAQLLDQLGFDTYTAFVMGTPNRETESVRAMRQDRASARVERLEGEVDRLRQELPGGSEDRWNATERSRIVSEAARLLGTPADGLARLTTVELVDLLRDQQERPSPSVSAEVLAASGRLAAALVAAGAPSPGAAADPEAMQALARRWLDEEQDRTERRTSIERAIEDADHERLRLDEATRRADDGGRAADLEAEAQVLRARVAECEERVGRHQRATAELAELRAQELELRDRERDLLVRISDRERLLNVLGADVPPPVDATVAPAGPVLLPDPEPTDAPFGSAPSDAEALRRVVDRDASVAWPVDREWQLLARLGEVRSVGAVGSVPLIVSGIDPTSVDTPALLHRIASMSELVQTVVLADDERLARWATGLDDDARLVRW